MTPLALALTGYYCPRVAKFSGQPPRRDPPQVAGAGAGAGMARVPAPAAGRPS